MELYHATTQSRGEKILNERCIKKNVPRYYSDSSNGPTTQGFVYLANEITFSVYFANCHNISEGNTTIYVFKIDIPNDILEPDEDEIEIQSPENEGSYSNRLSWSLEELKSCRVGLDIDIDAYPTQICRITDMPEEEIVKLVEHAAFPFSYVVSHYTENQLAFLNSIRWHNVQ